MTAHPDAQGSAQDAIEQPWARKLDMWAIVALVVVLIGRPLIYSALPLGREFVYPIMRGDRAAWYTFHGIILMFQWIPFLLIAYMLYRNGEKWSSLGVDWVSAGVAEEVQYRGLPFTRLRPALRSPWLVLPVTMLSFLFVHGTPQSPALAVNYLIVGALFGGAFIMLKLRRLELLMLVHFLIDAGMVVAP